MACFPDTLDKVMTSEASTLKIEWGCGHQAQYVRADALRRFGPAADPMFIRRWAACPTCGARSPGRVWV